MELIAFIILVYIAVKLSNIEYELSDLNDKIPDEE